MLQAFVANGHDVLALAPRSDSTKRTLKEWGVDFFAIEIERNSINIVADLKYFFSLVRILRETKPAVVLAYTLKPVVFGGLATLFSGYGQFNAMITGRGQVFSGRRGFRPGLIRGATTLALRFGLLNANRVFFQNGEDLEFFVSKRIVARRRAICTTGSGVDLAHFAMSPLPATTSFLMLARLIPEKGVFEYAAAARLIKGSHPGVTFRIAGMFEPGKHGIDEELLAHWKAEGLVEYLGNLSDVREAIATSSVVVLPSYYPEGVPRSLQEALAMGRPVVTTDMPGCRETVNKGRTGFLVPPRDPDALAKALLRFVEDPDLARQMAYHCREYAVERYDATTISRQILDELGLSK